MAIKYLDATGFTPSSQEELLKNLIAEWNKKTGSNWDFKALSKDFGIIMGYLSDMIIKNETEMSNYVSKSLTALKETQKQITTGLYAWNSFVLYMLNKGFQVSRESPTNWDGTLKLYIYDTKQTPTPPNLVLEEIFNNYAVSDNYTGSIEDNITDTLGNIYKYAYTPAIINTDCKIKVNITYKRVSDNAYIDDLDIQKKVVENFNKNYKLGNNFSPFQYITLNDIPYALNIAMQFSKDGNTYLTEGALILEKNTYYKIVNNSQIVVNKVIL